MLTPRLPPAAAYEQVERDSAREATRTAREAFSQSRAAYNERAAPVRELQQQRQDAAASANKLKDSFRWVHGGRCCLAAWLPGRVV